MSTGLPRVLSEAEVRAEVLRLVAELRAAREASPWTTRQVAEAAGMNSGTLWRLERGRNMPTFQKLATLAAVLGLLLEVDDGRNRPRRPGADQYWLPAGYSQRAAIVHAEWAPFRNAQQVWLHNARSIIGAEMWWGRQFELDPPLDAAAVCRLLGMSPHTLLAVESGPAWPDVASIVRVAGVTGRRLTLTPEAAGRRAPPWPTPE